MRFSRNPETLPKGRSDVLFRIISGLFLFISKLNYLY